MKLQESLITEIKEEAKSSARILERVPVKSFDWKPHEKSFTLSRLASHVAEINGWVTSVLDFDEMDFATYEYKPPEVTSSEELIKLLNENTEKAVLSLENVSDEEFSKMWTMRNGETLYFTLPKIVVIREFAMNHLYHHRGQLTVYLRLLDIPVPGMYGPTADEQMM